MKTKKFPIAILKKIEVINSLLDKVNQSEVVPYTYDGGTYPHTVLIKPIVVNNQFVTIRNNGGTYIEDKERYNVNKISICGDLYCRDHLNHTLNTILKAFNKI